ncbi:UvrD-helicase domain-containing protein [Alteribacter populi]|uniref:UvrD-helicase domain-containing protein n=1 Tax=Alteribacter populi TaxID=2011011 RepID=UPI000BBAF934|nr:ATP-dependent helicase [Alteribacter populi]
MQRALHKHTTYELPSLERGALHSLYQKSKKGELLCPYCREPVQLHVNLHVPPSFVHRKPKQECEEADEQALHSSAEKPTMKEEETPLQNQVGAFSLPVKKTITSSTRPETKKQACWKPSHYFANSLPFHATTKTVNSRSESKDPVLLKIEQKGTPLNPHQQEAVTTLDGPLLLLAGAGSGKTRVLTSRAAYLLKTKHVKPENMMLVTFTQKAAAEMKDRLETQFGLERRTIQRLVSGTFHSLFYKMLMHHSPDLWKPDQLLKHQWQKEKIIFFALRELSIDERDFAIDGALSTISAWKNDGKNPKNVETADHWEKQVKDIFRIYEQEKAAAGMFDFDDMLLGCYTMLTENPNLLAKYQQRFSHFMIDEFQDINRVQYDIMKLLVTPQNNLCVVGDDDQSIYRFRGSNPIYILTFKDTFPNARVIHLENNYRSEQNIVELANGLIAQNEDRYEKKMAATIENTSSPTLLFPYDEEEEAIYIVENIKKQLKMSSKPEDILILYRTHVQSRAIFERLLESGLPFSMEQGSDSFYNRSVVRKALSYLRLSLNGDDTEAMQDWLRVMFLKQSILLELKRASIMFDETILEATKRSQESMTSFQRKKLLNTLPHFKKLKELSPREALLIAHEKMGLADYIKKNGKEGNKMDRGSDDFQELLSIASHYSTVTEFLSHVDHIRAKVKVQQKENQQKGIQLMTIHRAKGLEFPTVYILGCNEGTLPHEHTLEKLREGDESYLEEERRLMYVSVTRAKRELFLSATDMRRGKKAYRSRFLRDVKFNIKKDEPILNKT